ncbi:unnamed protein product [Cyprideis torosa]|uniref:Uncharacterized protein n=1 Tax=Cyprideis torosa TaxID=163714 RepID=A0A7R8WA57_9CRUS|nr:unnamed protein product [Cyprideis torosa]CAG0890554.1 unnamed protein product [Cyprideis torosa]
MALLFKLAALFSVLAVISGRPQGRGYQPAQQQQYAAPQQQQSYTAPQQPSFSYGGNLQTAAQNLVPTQTGAGMPYNFNWAVNAPEFGNDYSHSQQSDGRVTTGEYRVLLPDTRVQIVRFTADENGYVADVSYEGTAQYAAASNVNQVVRPSGGYQQQAQQQQYSQPQAGYAQPQQSYSLGRR